MLPYKIGTDDMSAARDYVPIAEKALFVSEAATQCIKAVSVKNGEEEYPDMFMENASIKQRFLLGALLKLYLFRDFDPVSEYKYLVSADDFDRWMQNSPLPTLERMKSDKELRDKVYNLMYDFKQLKKMLESEIHGCIEVMNDVVPRLKRTVDAQIMKYADTMDDVVAEAQREAEKAGVREDG